MWIGMARFDLSGYLALDASIPACLTPEATNPSVLRIQGPAILRHILGDEWPDLRRCDPHLSCPPRDQLMDILSTIPDFPTKSYAHILPSLERANIAVKDLVLFDPLEIAKQAKVAVTDVRALAENVINALHRDLGLGRYQGESIDVAPASRDDNEQYRVQDHGDPIVKLGHRVPELSFVSTLDPVLDRVLAGGISTGYVTELAGESGCGKTQFLLHLLLSVQLPPPYGTSQKALYLSTESNLPTNRLSQLLEEHPVISTLPEGSPRPSLENILSITTIDLESQDHILNYQIPVAVSRYNIGLVVIDSITANYRAESDLDNVAGLLARAWQLKKLGQFLRNLAAKQNIAIVVANQVSDRIQMDDVLWVDEPDPPTSSSLDESPFQHQSQPPSSHPDEQLADDSEDLKSSPSHQLGLASSPMPSAMTEAEEDEFSLSVLDLGTLLKVDYQRPFFTGWGDSHASTLEAMYTDSQSEWKTPALGIVWTNQIACRIVLKMENIRIANQRTKDIHPELNSNNLPPAVFDGPDSRSPTEAQLCTPLTQEQNQKNPTSAHMESENRRPQKEETANKQKANPANSTTGMIDDPLSTTISSYRKQRTIQVVFSPWTSGDPNHTLGCYESGPTEGREMVEYDPTFNKVGFEIHPGGIRGISPINDD
ncbi:RecA family ATPase Rhp57 [Histoplasma capsulatum G186AR]|uniref:RecA family ATPase Rhp57 n=2 Tax=Ajellomyces capsulatus TaxID=5037 RepID=C0NKK9_AJECG|nr:RecA family ATPase Rhp57 [Histoplasma capsulatum G186AR]EEH08400.1 RecA family ATPase Rhp57 [Histoplasma capsulatum G186AR]